MEGRWIDGQVQLTSAFLDQFPDKERLESRLTQTTDYAKVIWTFTVVIGHAST